MSRNVSITNIRIPSAGQLQFGIHGRSLWLRVGFYLMDSWLHITRIYVPFHLDLNETLLIYCKKKAILQVVGIRSSDKSAVLKG